MKRPSFQFYPKDFLADRRVATMSNEQRGGYMLLLCYMWQEEACALPNDNDELCSLSGLDIEKIRKVLMCFIAHPSLPDHISHKRLLEEREKQDHRRKKMSDAGKRGNEKRWGKPKKEPSQGDHDPIANDRSSSPSSASADPLPPKGDGDVVFFKLMKWFKKMDDVEDPAALAKTYLDKYPTELVKTAMNHSASVSRAAFSKILDGLMPKKTKKSTSA